MNVINNGLKVRNLILQPGRPKVAVPIVSTQPADIIEECESIKTLPCDMVEWRADYYLSNIED
ncbi:MAG: type I 3-dehydroquinate dehydratase, partial [Firmicutes bacterium]|nr:type I 3-dehydroquinate dehydratase [Bacillota bacterium]